MLKWCQNSMLDQCICVCVVLIININDGIKERTCGHENCNTSQKLTVGRHVKVRESLPTQVIIWVDIILHHMILVQCYLSMKVLAGYIYLNSIKKTKIPSNTHTLLVSKSDILIIDTQMVFNKIWYQSNTGRNPPNCVKWRGRHVILVIRHVYKN